VTSMTMEPTATRRPIDPDGLSMDGIRDGALRGRAVTVLGFARSGIALARFLVDTGADVTIYDGRPAIGARGRDRCPRRSDGSAPPRAERRPRRGLAGRRARHELAFDQPRLPDD